MKNKKNMKELMDVFYLPEIDKCFYKILSNFRMTTNFKMFASRFFRWKIVFSSDFKIILL